MRMPARGRPGAWAPGAGVGRAFQSIPPVCSPSDGRGTELGTGVITEPVGDPGLSTVWPLDEDLASRELLEVGDRGPVPDRRDGYPQLGRPLDDLLGRVAKGPGLDGRLELLGPLGPHVDVDQRLVGQQVAPFDEDEEVLELLVGDGGETHPAVGGGLDRRVVDVAEGRLLGGDHPIELGEERPVGVHAERHRLQHRQVDLLADARSPPRSPGGDGGHGGVHPGLELAEAPPDGERWAVLASTGARRAAGRLQRELGRRTVRPRSGPAEGADGEDHEVGVGLRQPVDVQGAVTDDDIGARGQLVDGADHRALGGVQEPEESRVLVRREFDAGGRPPAQGVTFRPLDLDHVRAGVGQELGGVGPGHLGRGVDDPQSPQHAFSMAHRTTGRDRVVPAPGSGQVITDGRG